MTTTRFLVAGDIGKTDDFEFVGVLDLLGVPDGGIVGHVWRASGPRDAHDVTVEVLDGATRMCRVHWGDAPDDWLPSLDVARLEVWRFEVEAAWPDDDPRVTSPVRAPVLLRVRPQGDYVEPDPGP